MPKETAIFKQRTYQHYGVVVLASLTGGADSLRGVLNSLSTQPPFVKSPWEICCVVIKEVHFLQHKEKNVFSFPLSLSDA